MAESARTDTRVYFEPLGAKDGKVREGLLAPSAEGLSREFAAQDGHKNDSAGDGGESAVERRRERS